MNILLFEGIASSGKTTIERLLAYKRWLAAPGNHQEQDIPEIQQPPSNLYVRSQNVFHA